MRGIKLITPLLSALLVYVGYVSVSQAQPLLIASGEYKPFASSQYNGGGFLHEFVMRALEDAGLPAQDLFLPWGRGFSGVQKHHFAATFPYIWTESRAATFLYSKPLIVVAGGLYVRRENAHLYKNPEDMVNVIFCLPRGFSSEFLKPFIGELRLRLERAADDLGCLEMLALGRVDGAPVDVLRALELMKENPDMANKIELLPWSTSKKTYHLIVDKSYPNASQILAKFDQSYDRVKSSAVWSDVLSKYAIDPKWAETSDQRILPLSEFKQTE